MAFRVGVRGLIACCLFLAAAIESATAATDRAHTPEFETRSWTTAEGLPDDSVTSVQQTAEGFLWVGTSRGLVRFDGWTFVPVAAGQLAQSGEVTKVTAQCVDAENRVWFGTDKQGLFRLDPRRNNGLSAERIGLAGEKVFCLGKDPGGGIWIGTEGGLVKWAGGQFTRLKVEPDVADPAVLALQVTRSNGVWVTTRAGLRRYVDGVMQRGEFEPMLSGLKAPVQGVFEDRQGSLWVFGDTYLLNVQEGRRFNYFRGGGATLLQVWSMCEGKPGEWWIGTTGQGLFHFAAGRFRAVDMREGRGYSAVQAVFVDREGSVWVGTQRGLVQLRERTVRWYTGGGSAATCLTEDPDGRVWAGFEHGGLASGKSGILEPAAGTIPLAGQNLITSMFSRGDASLWMGTMGNGLYRVREGRTLHYTIGHGLTDDTILAVAGGGAGRVWVSTSDGRLHRYMEQLVASYGPENGLTGHPVTALSAAVDGGMWAGTSHGEVLRSKMEHFRPLPPVPEFAGKAVLALRQDSKRRLWVGTRGGGLGCFAGETWKIWNVEAGLPDNAILAIEQAIIGDLWVATARGICRLPEDWPDSDAASRRRVPILVEFPTDPAEAASAGWPRSLRSRDGMLWFATDHGVVSFSPADLRRPATSPTVRIETLRANGLIQFPSLAPNGQVVHAGNWGDGKKSGVLRLPAGLRDLEIRFTAPSLALPDRTRFRHKLEGFDPEWQDSTATRRARYGKLPSGEYQFHVTASDAEGGWTGPDTSLSLEVPAPAWRSSWAIALASLALIAAAASVARVVSHRRLRRQVARLEQQRAMERERARIAQDMHDELGAKLTRISFLSERARNDLAEPSATSSKLDSIAVTSRELLHSLDEIVWAVNPRNDTLEHLAAYLGQYAAEYLEHTSVEYELRLPRALPGCALSAEVRHNLFLAFKEALGNALKHSGATIVRVEMFLAEREFAIQVVDNGRGLAPSVTVPVTGDGAGPGNRRRGMGLRGMHDRLADCGGRCAIRSAPGEGTVVTLKIPVSTEMENS